MQYFNEAWPVYAILQKKDALSKNSEKLRPVNKFQALLILQRIKHNLYWKMKFLKQPAYIRYKGLN